MFFKLVCSRKSYMRWSHELKRYFLMFSLFSTLFANTTWIPKKEIYFQFQLAYFYYYCESHLACFCSKSHYFASSTLNVREYVSAFRVDCDEGWKMKSPPRLGLGTILDLLSQSLTCTGLHTRLWVWSLDTA